MDQSTILAKGAAGGSTAAGTNGSHPASGSASGEGSVTRSGTPRYPPLRPDGTAIRSWRATAAVPPPWRAYLIPVNGSVVARRRRELGIGGQRALADLLSSREHVVQQPEVSDLEHGGTYVNDVYLLRLSEVLNVSIAELTATTATTATTGGGQGGRP